MKYDHTPISTALRKNIESGQLVHDTVQAHCAAALDTHMQMLEVASTSAKKGFFGLFASSKDNRSAGFPYKGAYIFGPPGRGKTLLMDMMFHAAPCKKRRIHFHAFMQDVHAQLATLRKSHTSQDPLAKLGAQIANEIRLLCFDEFHVRDIADAMILERLFYALNDHGVHIICTSNWLANDLYKDGLQRNRFLGFITYLKAHFEHLTLEQPIDYRLHHSDQQVLYDDTQQYFTPDDDAGQLSAAFHARRGDTPITAHELLIGKRALVINRCADDLAFFVFEELCDANLGAADYQAICDRFRHIFIDNVPLLVADDKNRTLRFMTLIDIVYESQT
ncbi:MAG: cell division protein ZapE, partial [Pseudomonadota bacterium]